MAPDAVRPVPRSRFLMTFRQLLGAQVQGDGPRTLVFGNGFSTTQQSWDGVVGRVPQGWRVIRFDYVGTTPASTDRWIAERYATYDGHADDLLRLLAELEIADALFVGHSMSAMIGALAASRDPARFQHLILIGGSPCYRDDGDYRGGFTGAQIADLLLRANADLAAWMGGFAPVMLGADATPQQITDFVRTLVAIRPDIGRLMVRSIFTSDYRALLSSVRTDVTVVQGLDDRAVPASVGRYLVAHLPCRAYHELDLPGHLPHITHPDVIGTIVAETCARTERPGAPA